MVTAHTQKNINKDNDKNSSFYHQVYEVMLKMLLRTLHSYT